MATGADAAEHTSSGMPQLNFETFPNQIFWLAIALVIMYFVLSRIALPRIGSVLEDRHNTIANDLEQANNLKRKAEEAEEAYNKALADARAEANRIAEATKADIKKDIDAAVAKADAEIAAKVAESEAQIAEIRKSALKSVEDVANATTEDIVNAILPGSADAKSVKAAITSRLKG